MFHNLFLFGGWLCVLLWFGLSEAVEELKRKVAGLVRESEELQRYKRDIDWLRTLQKKIVRNSHD